jgi:hypothetical protein
MTCDEIRIGAQVYDRNQHRTGIVLAVHKPANPNLDTTEALVEIDRNAFSWISFDSLEEINN